MRIAHVVTLISADGAFGGPVAVARGQAIELARRGHDVHLLAGWDGVTRADAEESSLSVRLFRSARLPRTGFAGLVAPGLVSHLASHARDFDIIHVHLARDLVTMPAAQLAWSRKVPYVTQTHGMIRPDARPLARVTDALGVRRLLTDARAAFALTPEEEDSLRAVAGDGVSVKRLPNGLAVQAARTPGAERQRAADPPVVLFLARLHPRKRVLAFAEMASLMVSRGVNAKFAVVGPDEGDLSALDDFVSRHELHDKLTYEGALPPDLVSARLGSANVFVLPSVNEPFPMTVLEAMAQGTPSVITDTCMISQELAALDAAAVTDGSPAALADAVSWILADKARARTLGVNARAAVRDHFSISAVVDQLEHEYQQAVL